ncbi:MAG: PepSY-like domain-containing protein [Cytophagales bacterium]
MKKSYYLIFLSLFILTPVLGQMKATADVPKVIEKSFNRNYPQAKMLTWENTQEGQWLATYKSSEKQYLSNYSKSGNWEETRNSIEASELPLNVNIVLDRKYKNYNITEVDHVTKKDGTYYDITIDRDGNLTDLIVNSQGHINEKSASEAAESEDMN